MKYVRILKCIFALIFAFAFAMSAGVIAYAESFTYFVEFNIPKDKLLIDGEGLSELEYSRLKDEIKELVNDVELKLSLKNEGSDVARLNSSAIGNEIEISEYAYEILELCKRTETNGKFVPTAYALTKLWGFSSENAGNYTTPRSEPSATEIQTAKDLTDFNDVTIRRDGERFYAKRVSGVMLDLGGVAKGYICDKVGELIRAKYPTQSKILCYDVMSNACVMGEYVDDKRSGWRVGVENPRVATTVLRECLRVDNVIDKSFTSSSDKYRFYVYDNKIYSHIIDVESGKPADCGIIQVNVFIPNSLQNCGALCDIYSTSAFCMPLTDGINFLSDLHSQIGLSAIIITADFKYYVIGDIDVKNAYEASSGTIENVFTLASASEAVDEIVACENEIEYINYISSIDEKDYLLDEKDYTVYIVISSIFAAATLAICGYYAVKGIIKRRGER